MNRKVFGIFPLLLILVTTCKVLPDDPMQRRLYKHYHGKGTLYINEPEYDSFWTVLQTDSGIFAYEQLFLDYLYGDTLSLPEARFLYYGYIYSARYIPFYPAEPYLDSAISLIFNPDSSDRQWQLIIASSLLDSVLSVDPFNLEALFLYMTLCDELNDSVCVDISIARMSNVINAIMSTGTGKKPNTSIDVIAFPHIDNVLFFFALPEKKRKIKTWANRYIIKVKLKRNTARIKKLFFDVTPANIWLINFETTDSVN